MTVKKNPNIKKEETSPTVEEKAKKGKKVAVATESKPARGRPASADSKLKKSVKKPESKKGEEKEPVKMGPIVLPPKPKPQILPQPVEVETPPQSSPKGLVSPPSHLPKKEEPKKASLEPKVVKHIVPPIPSPQVLVSKKGAPKEAKKEKSAIPQEEKAIEKEIKVPVPSPAAEAIKKKIVFNEMMTVKDLAEGMNLNVADVIKKLLTLGSPATINQRLSLDAASLVAEALGFELDMQSIYLEDKKEDVDSEEQLKPRPPVVTVMGHVDHGKTSLLDAIRSSRVAEGEAGGITQHIGAYQIQTKKGVITFLDTPGHEAFTAMRARGATVTDLVVLVVAADDSVMPQTVEAIDHAKAAGVPIVVAINKVDLPTANVQKVKQELSNYNLVPEEWSGKTQMVEVSARTKQNIDKLLDMILLEAEILELKANPDRPARGIVLEARLDPKRGITASVLIQKGTLRVGDVVVCGLRSGRVRALLDQKNQPLEKAGPSTPVGILGLGQVPHVGDQLAVVKNEKEAREIVSRRSEQVSESTKERKSHITLESLHSQIEAGEIQELKIILKADVQGSLQALQDALMRLSTSAVHLQFIHVGVGNINDSDVLLAETSDSIIFGFNVKIESSAETEAKRAGVDIRLYNIIYEMMADIRAAMEGLLKPIEIEVLKGRALVKGVFPASKFGAIAGCLVQEGKIVRGQKAKILRGGQVVGQGTIGSLKRFKDDVREVEKGFECGVAVEGVKSFEVNDLIEVFVIEKQARRL